MTNAEFRTDNNFIKCCEAISIEPSIRQASKFRNSRGRAFTEGKKLVKKGDK